MDISDPSTLTISSRPVICADPTGVSVASLTPTGFTVNWTPAAGIATQQIILNNGTPIVLASNINTYDFTGLPSGSNNSVMVRSVCTNSASTGVTVSAQLTGCAAPTGLVLTPTAYTLGIKFVGVSNALHYVVEVRKNSDNSLKFTKEITNEYVLAEPLESGVLYDISVVAYCGVAGSTLVASSALVGQSTTSGAIACESAVILTNTITQNSIDFTFNFTSGRTTGNFKIVVRKQSDNSIVHSSTLSEIWPVSVTGLLAGTGYDLYVYNETSTFDILCTPAILLPFNTLATCAPPTAIVLTLQTNDTELEVDATASVSSPPDYAIEYRKGTGSWISVGNQTLPYVITGITPGKYQVRLKSNCVGSPGTFVESGYACTTPVVDLIGVNQNAVNLSWIPMEGVSVYQIEIRSLAGGTATYSTPLTNFNVTGLAWNTNFIATVKAECDSGVFVSSSIFSFATGNEVSTTDSTLCPAPDFTAFTQDCEVTDPGGSEHPDPTPEPSQPSECSIIDRTWTTISSLFTNVTNDPPNNAFIEVTMMMAQNQPSGVVALMPGGILGVVTAPCRPTSTLSLSYTIIQGGELISGSLDIATNGNITISGSYNSTGGSALIIRGSGNYIK